jgi:hypothetical protein
MILCEWDAPEGDPGQSCVHLPYPIVVSHLSFNFLCLLLLYSIYLSGQAWGGGGGGVCGKATTKKRRLFLFYSISPFKMQGDRKNKEIFS